MIVSDITNSTPSNFFFNDPTVSQKCGFLDVSSGHAFALRGSHQDMEIGRMPYKWPVGPPSSAPGPSGDTDAMNDDH
jgi:hypothetical protein